MKKLIVVILVALTFFTGQISASINFYVNCDTGDDSLDGLAPEWDGVHGPVKTINRAVSLSSSGDEILVAPGIYESFPIDFSMGLSSGRRNIVLKSESGSEVTTIIHKGFGAVFYFVSGETPAATVEGFTITSGANTTGGIICNASSPTIKNCIITGIKGSYSGAVYCSNNSSPAILSCIIRDNETRGFYSLGGNPVIKNSSILRNAAIQGNGGGISAGKITVINSIISDNSSQLSGGGIICGNGSSIINCIVKGNFAYENGGGIYLSGTSAVVKDTVVDGNWSCGNGAGIYCSQGTAVEISNCLVTQNYAGGGFPSIQRGGGMYIVGSPMISNCTIADNLSDYGSGIYFSGNGLPVIRNSIIWQNFNQQIALETGAPTFNHCNIQGGWSGAGTNNIDSNPYFVRGPLHDYYLSHFSAGQTINSPCIDAGDDSAENYGLDSYSTRTDHIPDNGQVDIGYHSNPYLLKIESIQRNGNEVRIRWNALPGIDYSIGTSSDLIHWTFSYLGQVSEYTEYSVTLNPSRYYRIRQD